MFELKLENANGNIVDINDGEDYLVVSIEGLNPPSATLFTSKSPNKKGGKHNGSTLDERRVIVTIKPLGDVERNRNALYEWVDPEQYVKIHYRNGVKNVYCEGYVADCPIDFFTSNEVVAVSIVCADPYLKDMQEVISEISNMEKNFVFPFAIGAAGIPFSTVRATNATNILYDGAETGVKIYVLCRGTVSDLTIFDDKDTSRRFQLRKTLYANDIVEIDTEGSPKTCKIYHPDGTVENGVKYVAPAPTWFTLKKGYNVFGYSLDGNQSDVEVTFNFRNKYLGV